MSRRNPNDKTIAISVTIPKRLVDSLDYLVTTEKGFQTRSGLITKYIEQGIANSRTIKEVKNG